MSTATKQTQKTNEGVKQFPEAYFSLWKNQSKGGSTYFTGKDCLGNELVAFFNGQKKNPNEPDLRINVKKDGKMEDYGALWLNTSKKGNQYLAGHIMPISDNKDHKVKVVCYIIKANNPKVPYVKGYLQEEMDKSKVDQAKFEPKEADPKPLTKEVVEEVKKEVKPKDLF